jgi:hypothetical protein
MNKLKLSLFLLTLISGVLVSSCGSDANSPFDEDKSCVKTDLPTIKSKDNGYVVTQHDTICEDEGRVFVFLHKENEKDALSNMIFVYSEIAEFGKSPYPDVLWIDHNSVKISVSRIGSMYRNKRTLHNIKIIYDIGQLDAPDLFYELNHFEENGSTPDKIKARSDFNKLFAHSDDFPDLEFYFHEDWSQVRKVSILDFFR